MNEQREKFEAWANSAGFGLKYRESMFAAWEGAIASQAPRQALSDAEIGEIAENYKFKEHYRSNSEAIQFAKRVLAASGPNASLVAALKKIERNEQVVFDEDINGDVIVSMDTDDMIEIARAALAAVGEGA